MIDDGYTYTWSFISGLGTIASGQTTNSITVHWGSDAGTEALQVSSTNGCPLVGTQVIDVNVFLTFISAVTGDFDVGATWEQGEAPGLGDNIRIRENHTVTMQGPEDLLHVIIDSAGVLDNSGEKLTIAGSYILNGTHNATTGGAKVTFNGATDADIDGNGGVLNTKSMTIVNVIRDVVASADITFNATAFTIDGAELQNEGILRISNAIDTINGGQLDASITDNTVYYDGTVAQTVLGPKTSYYNLTIENASTKTLTTDLDIDNELSLLSGTLDVDAASNFSINIAGDWTNSGDIFNEQMGTVTFDGITDLTGSETFYAVVIDQVMGAGESAVTLLSNMIITDSLALTNGLIDSDSTNLLSINSGAFVADAIDASFVNGPMEHTGITAATIKFPLGAGTEAHQIDLTVNGPSQDYLGDFILESAVDLGFTLPLSLERVSDIDYWGISTAGAVTTAMVELYYNASDFVSDESKLRVAKDDGGGNWLDILGVGSSSPAGTIQSGLNFTDFSLFSLANDTAGSNALPVELLFFEAKPINTWVELSWATASEVNNNFFAVERSGDGFQFEELFTVAGAGHSQIILSYQVADETPLPGISFYRLRQVDFDGTFAYSPIRVVDYSGDGSIIVFPNPTAGEFTMRLGFVPEHEVSIVIRDLLGHVVYEKEFAGSEIQIYPESRMNPGVYLVSVIYGHQVLRKKLAIVR